MADATIDHPLMKRINDNLGGLTPKGRMLAEYIMKEPRSVVFMTVRELSKASGVSESSIVRFVGKLGYKGYSHFIQALRDFLDTGMTLVDRVSLSDREGGASDRLKRLVADEQENLRRLEGAVDAASVERFSELLANGRPVYVVGSRISYAFSYYFGWSLTKVRSGVQILKGSDSAAIDWLTIAPENSVILVIALSRYPNELIQLGKMARRRGLTLAVISDSTLCPLNQFAHETLVAPSHNFPLIGSHIALNCLLEHLILEITHKCGDGMKAHQERLEQSYRENDVLFNLDDFRGYLDPGDTD